MTVVYGFVQTMFSEGTKSKYSSSRCVLFLQPKSGHKVTTSLQITVKVVVFKNGPFWNAYLNPDHGLVCGMLVLLFNGRQSSWFKRIDTNKLASVPVVIKYQSGKGSKLNVDSPQCQ